MPKQGPSNLARLSLLMPTLLAIIAIIAIIIFTKVDCSSECVEHGRDGLGQALHKVRLRPLLFEHLNLMTLRKNEKVNRKSATYSRSKTSKVPSKEVRPIQSYGGPDPDTGATEC
jgi:hypothetical protein